MNRITLTLKRPFIWLSRFRHRCGYGVHSPFAFNLITQVIYESTPYYKYKDLAVEQKKLAPQKDNYWKYESKKVKRLLFRLVNYIQPDTIVDGGGGHAAGHYPGCRQACRFVSLSESRKGGSGLYSGIRTFRIISGSRRTRRFPLSA